MSSDDSIGPIVVPLDGSRNAENALPHAALLARVYGATVEWVRVVDHEGLRTEEEIDRFREAFATYASYLADKWAIAKYESSVSQGPVAAKILETASTASFVVIASHGHGGFHATFIGSVADKVVRGSTVPVLLVPGVGAPTAPEARRFVLIGLDGSEAAEQALRVGRSLAARMEAPVALVRAWDVPAQALAFYEGYAEYPADNLFASAAAIADEYLKRTATPREKVLVPQGAPAPVIANAATRLDAGLVVVASSGKGLAARIALGSTTDRLMRSLHRPLLIVPE